MLGNLEGSDRWRERARERAVVQVGGLPSVAHTVHSPIRVQISQLIISDSKYVQIYIPLLFLVLFFATSLFLDPEIPSPGWVAFPARK